MAGRTRDIPVVMMTREAADKLVTAADTEHRSLMDLRKLADKKGDVIELPGAQVTLKAKLEKIDIMTDNVGAILPGKGNLADEFIVIGSHYDHVGYGYFGSRDPNPQGKIHPGADDNASGTSGNLLLAKKLAAAYKNLPDNANVRSVLFLAFSAEESGLVGSAYYVKHPIEPLAKHYLMLNMDMIGRLRDGKLEVDGVGTADGLKAWCQPYWDHSGLKIKAGAVGPSNSDHASFYTHKVPDLFFFTGYHAEYHTPKDVVALINFEGAAKVSDLIERIALDAAQRPEPFPFSDGLSNVDKHVADNDANPHQGGDNSGGGSTGLPVRLGIMADYNYDEKPGVMIDHLSTDKGMPAELAGLKAGDLMTRWDGEELKDVQNWMTILRKHKPGDKVRITFVRDGKEQTTIATLVGPPGEKQ
jgi:hypothetical protein